MTAPAIAVGLTMLLKLEICSVSLMNAMTCFSLVEIARSSETSAEASGDGFDIDVMVGPAWRG